MFVWLAVFSVCVLLVVGFCAGTCDGLCCMLFPCLLLFGRVMLFIISFVFVFERCLALFVNSVVLFVFDLY